MGHIANVPIPAGIENEPVGRIPVSHLAELARRNGQIAACLLTFDGERTHVVTWGSNGLNCSRAAVGGNRLKKSMGWPDSLAADGAEFKRLQVRVKDLERQLAARLGS